MNAAADHDGDSKPIPDPTTLTTEQLIRETTALNNTLQLQLTAQQTLVDEKLESVSSHLEHIERQRVEQKQDTKAAVDAALAAAKEEVKEQTAPATAPSPSRTPPPQSSSDRCAVLITVALLGLGILTYLNR